MLDRQKGDVVFECDGCGEVLETGQADFGAALSLLRRDGWRAVKAGDDWEHYCLACRAGAGRGLLKFLYLVDRRRGTSSNV